MKRLVLACLFLLMGQGAAENCDFTSPPPGLGDFELVPMAQGALRPIKLVSSPLSKDEFFVVEQAGTLRVLKSWKWDRTFLDIRDRVTQLTSANDERGLLGFAFHPRFRENARFYLNYTTKGRLRTRISEFTVDAQGLGHPGSEKILLQIDQPYSNHNGGEIVFGPDGYLYIGMGDGGSGGDPQGHAQNPQSLLGKILRIDVDGASSYAIPPDNPFVSVSGYRPEIWALGLRNPWRFSFDRMTGELWAGDVGQSRLEEIDIIKKGKNYGWNPMEGSQCYLSGCDKSRYEPPVFEYPRSQGVSVTGGFVYRGRKFPSLLGVYIFGDFGSGRIWGLRHDGKSLIEVKVVASSGQRISSFGEDAEGELYVVAHSGEISAIKPAGGSGSFPLRLSQTGCFKSLSPVIPIEGFVPYEVNSPLWSDGTEKERFIKLPAGRKLRFKPQGPWDLPEGTILLKHFHLPQATGRKLVETRFLVRTAVGFVGYSYEWEEAQTDALFLGGSKSKVVSLWEQGKEEKFSYYFPSGSDCLRCHTQSAGGTLGFHTEQLHRLVPSPTGEKREQLRVLIEKNILDAAGVPSDLASIGRLADYLDATHPTPARARALLHVQCASCHHPGNPMAQGTQDLRHHVSFREMGVCETSPGHGDLGVTGAKLLVPGNPAKSLLYLRMQTLDPAKRMPPLASHRTDKEGLRVLGEWIQNTAQCP